MRTHTRSEAADRAGATAEYVAHLTDLGILTLDEPDRYTDAHVRRVQVVQALERAGMSVEAVAALVRDRRLDLEFIDTAGRHVFAALSDTTFAELGERNGVPVELLLAMREAVGGKQATPHDKVREDELAILPLIALQHAEGFRPSAIERALRVYGDSLRRIAETEAEWWRTEIEQPMREQGLSEADVGRRAAGVGPRLAEASDRALLAIYHAQQMHAWSANIVRGIAAYLQRAGLHAGEERPPAMCFLDITGYTRLTQERGDTAAAELAERLGRIAQRRSVEHGGRPIKWLGDGVMFHFPDAAAAVPAALEMVASLADAGLPPAHVGVHAGPVVFQEGDYYGQTVNVAARIGEYARPGEVLVSGEVVEAVGAANGGAALDVAFDEVGPVELKGVAGIIGLYAARRSP